MLNIKLKRIGKKKKPFYNFIVIEKKSYINGKYTDKLGYFDPLNNNICINVEKTNMWIKKGAGLTKRVNNLLKSYKKKIQFNSKT